MSKKLEMGNNMTIILNVARRFKIFSNAGFLKLDVSATRWMGPAIETLCVSNWSDWVTNCLALHLMMEKAIVPKRCLKRPKMIGDVKNGSHAYSYTPEIFKANLIVPFRAPNYKTGAPGLSGYNFYVWRSISLHRMQQLNLMPWTHTGLYHKLPG